VKEDCTKIDKRGKTSLCNSCYTTGANPYGMPETIKNFDVKLRDFKKKLKLNGGHKIKY
jgi:hypothetical protein